jgi:hypothetical protein
VDVVIYDANGDQVRRQIGFGVNYVSVRERTRGDRVTHLSGMFANAPAPYLSEECMKKSAKSNHVPMKPKGKGGKSKGC